MINIIKIRAGLLKRFDEEPSRINDEPEQSVRGRTATCRSQYQFQSQIHH